VAGLPGHLSQSPGSYRLKWTRPWSRTHRPGAAQDVAVTDQSGAVTLPHLDRDQLPCVRTVEHLETFGTPEPVNRDKVENELADVHREWIAATPLVFVATADADGQCDVSLKGGILPAS
jgi:hypothetical protein